MFHLALSASVFLQNGCKKEDYRRRERKKYRKEERRKENREVRVERKVALFETDILTNFM
jgi:hypothetical protein